jgi:hypothetical protein
VATNYEMKPTPCSREDIERFLEIVDEFYRHAGRELPYVDCHADAPLSFDAQVDEIGFSVGYDPSAGEASMFLYCPFGAVPSHAGPSVLYRLLELNVGLARDHNASYCIDTHTQQVTYYLRCNPWRVDVNWLRDELVRVTQQCRQWRTSHFLGVSMDSDEGASAGPMLHSMLA